MRLMTKIWPTQLHNKVMKVEGGEPEAEDGNSNFGDFTTVEVAKEAAGTFNADWGDFKNVPHLDGNSQTKGDSDAVAEFGAFAPPCAPESVFDFGDLYSFQFVLGKRRRHWRKCGTA